LVVTVDTNQKSGEQVYNRVCMACHNTGLLKAPKLGDKDDWVTRIEKGEAILLQNSINGFNAMPPRGGNFVDDADMKLALQYMLASVGVETLVSVPVVKNTPAPVKQVATQPIIKIPAIPKVVSNPPISKPKTASVAASSSKGKNVYDNTCKSCHVVGIAGAPRIAEKKDWETRILKDEAELIKNAINGFNIMPPKGGNVKLTNSEVRLAVEYMLEVIKSK
ncbi:MAG: cytochrome c5 family protein, partial [Proteobacteria bacterium]|nr:cytochrome c5 family protein [Pseudomonadota bacterium]